MCGGLLAGNPLFGAGTSEDLRVSFAFVLSALRDLRKN